MKTFQKKVLNLLTKIPKGKITTYKIIAQKLNTKAYRAVGNILNKNKDPINYPCYKVIKSNGKIGGYSNGIKNKIKLLKKAGLKIKENKIKNFKEYLFFFK